MPGTIPAPVVPTFPEAGGGFWAGGSSSGMDETSGVTCDFSGPHCITTQSLGVTHYRNPKIQVSSLALGLSAGLINPGYNILGTGILCKVVAQVTVSKSYDCYATAAWTQNQTFVINSVSADEYGNSYGTPAEFSSAYVLGVAGSIETYQPYYHRRAWDPAIDVETTSAITVFNHTMGTRNLNKTTYPWQVTSATVDPTIEWGDMEHEYYPQKHANGAYWNGLSLVLEPYINDSAPLYQLTGGYGYAQESLGQLKNMVDFYIGNYISQVPGLPRWWNQDGSASQGLPAYDWKRHDWSTIT